MRHIQRRQRTATGEDPNHVGDVLRVEVRQVKRSQTRAIVEHPTHVGDVLGVEVRQVQRSQTGATIEHPTHVGDVLGVEVRHVQRSQTRAIGEHPTHVGDFLSVEVRYVQRRQRTAIGEHFSHVGYFRSIKVLQSVYLRKPYTMSEPPGSGGGTEISERGVEHHTSGGTVCHAPCSCPCREGTASFFFRLLDAPCRAGAGGTLVVVVEGEGGFVRALRHIGLASLRLRTLRRSKQETNQCEEHRTTIT